MKKLILFCFLLCLVACSAAAQTGGPPPEAGDPEASVGYITFFDVVDSGGIYSIIVWILIFSMWPVGIVLGCVSLIRSSLRKKPQGLPFSFRLLVAAPFFYFFISATSIMYFIISTTEILQKPTGALTKSQALALYISNALYQAAFTILNMTPFIFFMFLSILILHFRKPLAEQVVTGEGEGI